MNNPESKELTVFLKRIGIYQIIGGIIGLLMLAWEVKAILQFNVLVVMLLLFIILFFSYSIFCGVMCLRKNENALTLSMVNQLLQVLGVTYAGYGFSFMAGPYFTFNFDMTDLPGLSFGAGLSRGIIYFNTGDDQSILSINLIAIWIFYEILVMVNSLKEQERDRQIDSLGKAE